MLVIDYEKIEKLKSEGYTNLKVIGGRLCGLRRFIFTTGLVIGIGTHNYFGRYCYQNHADALDALNTWDGSGDPSGNWIKYKGEGGERCNPNGEQY